MGVQNRRTAVLVSAGSLRSEPHDAVNVGGESPQLHHLKFIRGFEASERHDLMGVQNCRTAVLVSAGSLRSEPHDAVNAGGESPQLHHF
jgi:hypothetical protein